MQLATKWFYQIWHFKNLIRYDKSKIEKETKEIEDGIEALYRLLPTEELKEGSIQDVKLVGRLTQDMNKSNFKDGDINQPPYENLICLLKFKDGRIIR